MTSDATWRNNQIKIMERLFSNDKHRTFRTLLDALEAGGYEIVERHADMSEAESKEKDD